MESMVAEIHHLFKADVVRRLNYRMHGDRAPELTGPQVKAWAAEKGIAVTTTAGFEPNSNGRAEAGVGWLKTKARTMLARSILKTKEELWPMAVAHSAVCQRHNTISSP